MSVADQVNVPVDLHQFFTALAYLAKCWSGGDRTAELDWFLQSLRGELPKRYAPPKHEVHCVFLPREQYLAALEALTTRLGVF